MGFKGNFKFHDDTQYGELGDFIEFMTNRESLDVFFCPQCGKVEFYIPNDNKEEEE